MSLLADFHFLRPEWLLMVPLLAVVWWFLRRPAGSLSAWRAICDEHLLKHLTTGDDHRGWRIGSGILAAGWVIAAVALAGPVWQKRPLPLFKTASSRVIVLDLSRSMLATDLTPNRLEQARFKLSDLLDGIEEGQVGLVAYAGEAFVVSPLTEDANTIKSMLGAMDPSIMPVQGSELDEALAIAGDLLDRGSEGPGEVLLITDAPGLGAEDAVMALAERGYRVSALGIGTPEGAPIPTRGGGFFKAADGSIVVPRLDEPGLRHLVSMGNGRFARMTANNQDLDYLLSPWTEAPERSESLDQEAEQWREEGPWLVLLLLPIAAMAFRRGWLTVLALMVVLPSGEVHALTWDDLWRRADQQAHDALNEGDPQRAVTVAEDPGLRGEALYRSGNFRSAESAYRNLDSADGHYNRGNALARQNRLEEAIAAYDEALSREPGMEDAIYNKQLLEELLKQQQEQEQQQNEGEQQESDEDQEGTEGDESEQGQDQAQENEQEQGEQQEGEQSEEQQAQQQELAEEEMSPEERQAVEQWLRRIPDDPGGLLRRKFMLEYQRRGSPKPATDEDW